METEMYEHYRKAGGIAKAARDYAKTKVKEGVLFLDVAEDVEDFIRRSGAEPAFPINLALNDAAAHFTPAHDDRDVFQKGDLVKIDVGVHVEGYVGDTAVTVEVGSNKWSDLVKSTKEALDSAIGLMKPNARLDDIGGAIQRVIEAYGFSPVENLTGHSMERYKLHAGLSVPNVMGQETGSVKCGNVIAIEPFATNGAGRVDGKKGGNIYRLVRPRLIKGRDISALVSYINENYRTLPFSERWCHTFDKKAKPHIRKLMRTGIIHSYPVLRDTGEGMVAQSEHTVIITESSCEIIT